MDGDLKIWLNVNKGLTYKKIRDLCINDRSQLDKLVSFALGEIHLIGRNAAYCLFLIAEQKPSIVVPYEKQIIELIPKLEHNSQISMLFQVLKVIPYEPNQVATILDFAFEVLKWDKTYASTKYSAIQFLDVVCDHEPDLAKELVIQLEHYLPLFDKQYLIGTTTEVIKKWRHSVN